MQHSSFPIKNISSFALQHGVIYKSEIIHSNKELFLIYMSLL